MTKQKDLKRLVRARMRKTGESYTAARAHLTRETDRQERPPADLAQLAGLSDAAVTKATGKAWGAWVAWLDGQGAADLTHKEIAKRVDAAFPIGGWWAQSVTVGYERIKGLRAKGERRGGGFDVNKSKTIGVPVDVLYRAFAIKTARAKWLPLDRLDLKVTTSSRDKSVRFALADGTRVDVYFWVKGPAKSQVQLQHRKLADAKTADEVRAFWTERLAELARQL